MCFEPGQISFGFQSIYSQKGESDFSVHLLFQTPETTWLTSPIPPAPPNPLILLPLHCSTAHFLYLVLDPATLTSTPISPSTAGELGTLQIHVNHNHVLTTTWLSFYTYQWSSLYPAVETSPPKPLVLSDCATTTKGQLSKICGDISVSLCSHAKHLYIKILYYNILFLLYITVRTLYYLWGK